MDVTEQKLPVNIEDEVRRAYLDYAMSVIIGRALPDVRDGLKPAHRRILYAMMREGLLSNRKYSKCAGIVGEVLKKYHPHGDAAVYDTLVRMAQEFNMRYLLVDGQGNFGSVDGDPPAAYRYTEARLTKLAETLMEDIDKETVDFSNNFDETTTEPRVLPARYPNLLVNGSEGIAVGMATKIPPHNLGEVIDGAVHLIENLGATVDELMRLIKAPDFPTGGYICGTAGVAQAYRTGRGQVIIRARATIEKMGKGDKEMIVVTEIPYQVNKAKLVEKIAELVRDKRIEGITDLRDESSREGMRIVIELRRDEDPAIVLNNLYMHTQLQTSFGIILLAIVDQQPRTLTLPEMLRQFIQHRRDVVRRRTAYDLRKAEARAHIVAGLLIALDNLDAVITLIRASKTPEEARAGLISQFSLTTLQAQAILEMQLQRLTGLERKKLEDEAAALARDIARYKEILGNDALVLQIVKDELLDIRKHFADERRSEIIPAVGEISTEELIAEEEMVITVTNTGYIKRTAASSYRSQRRGGKGRIGMKTKEEDFVDHLFIASTHAYILVFTDRGKVYWLKVHTLPDVGATGRGRPIVNLIGVAAPAGEAPPERVRALLATKEFSADRYIIMVTRNGIVKKTQLSAFANARAGGIIALGIEEGDELLDVRLTDAQNEILIATRLGQSIRFSETDVRPMGRTAVGVYGIRLAEGDCVIGMEVIAPSETRTLLTVTRKGYGKRTALGEYRLQGRGGSGIINLNVTDKTGEAVGIACVGDEDEIMFVTTQGMIIRVRARDISTYGRNTQGVRVMELDEGDELSAIAKLPERSDAGEDTSTDGDAPAGE
ncbi:MAG: DNA gyrase subunit A [Acidobacteria bacterium]|nr:DNA gyrase subunit A [Acidobacteriota bacterium]